MSLPNVEPPDNEFERIDPVGLSRKVLEPGEQFTKRIEVEPKLDKIKEDLKNRRYIMTKVKKKTKPFWKQKSTWKGVAGVLAAFGIAVNPEAVAMIAGGLFTIVGGIQIWEPESEDE